VSEDSWTIDELADRATQTLAEGGVRAPNGRVSAAPDRRAIRWYATIGLLDPPLRTRGRVARYGERHLLQLVAVKRRQAEGRSLAEIQSELAGATDATLRQVAGLAGSTRYQVTALPEPDRAKFWRERPAPAATAAVARLPDPPSPAPRPPDPGRPFHSPVRMLDTGAGARYGPARPLYLVPLHPAAALQLLAAPTDDDLAAIHHAAEPLLAELVARGLLPPEGNLQ
jgi:DNA-binding transcriptional MerR regulator